MPTYDYQCKACGQRWEKFQSMSADPDKTCPHCKQDHAQRLIGTGAAVIFKGGGFYETDYRDASYKKAADADKPDSEKKDKSETKESKPTEKPDKPIKPDPKVEAPKTEPKKPDPSN
jgi:putative FmdB family regulatory protein